MKLTASLFVLAIALLLAGPLQAQGVDQPTFVVTAPNVGGFYRGAVMLAAPFRGGHVGVILNRPSRVKVAEVFPDHAPSQKVKEVAYVGGQANADSIFVMHRAAACKSPRSFVLLTGICLELDAKSVDAVIEEKPEASRYYAGVVVWKAGELAKEISDGFMILRPADPLLLFLPDTSRLYQDLAPKRGQHSAQLRP